MKRQNIAIYFHKMLDHITKVQKYKLIGASERIGRINCYPTDLWNLSLKVQDQKFYE